MAAAGQLGSIVTVAGACTAAKWSAGHAILGCVSRKLRMLAGLRGRLAVLLSHPQEPAPFVQASVDRQAEPMRVGFQSTWSAGGNGTGRSKKRMHREF